MKTFSVLLSALFALSAVGATRYVDLNNPLPATPYTNWATAAASIQDGIDAAAAGDDIVVSNGVYRTGGQAVFGTSNRVAVTKGVTVRSMNGPAVTIIEGYPVPVITNGPAAVRCLYLANGAMLAGFTLTNGATQTAGDDRNVSGGGAWCESTGAVLSNCLITCNSAWNGGGASGGTLNNCILRGNWAALRGGGAYTARHIVGQSLNNCALISNSATEGGGAHYASLNNCTLTGNSAFNDAGGTYFGALKNCIAYYNQARLSGDNYYGTNLNYCCTIPLPGSGTGNFTDEPQLAGNWHLSAGSPCRGAGSAAYAIESDLDGEPWAMSPSVGCDEYSSGSATGSLTASILLSYTNVAVGFVVDLQAVTDGWVSQSMWDFGDGVLLSNRPYASHSWTAPGDYVIQLRSYNDNYPGGTVTSVLEHVVAQPLHYVMLDNPNASAPYATWATAATNIQDAVDVALPGATVLVSNGMYQTGARAVYGMSNRVAVTKPVTVQSVNGSSAAAIYGHQVPGAINGATAVRCVYLASGATLSGFTLTNGATQLAGDDRQYSGGAVWCESTKASVSNCEMAGNSGAYDGGAARNGTFDHCRLIGNSATATYATAGGVYGAILNNCALIGNKAFEGGGAALSSLTNCTLTSNSAAHGGGAFQASLSRCVLTANSAGEGGGAQQATLDNCTLSGNSASQYGGGTFNSTLNNCTLVGNSSSFQIGGAAYGMLNNCIVYYNTGSAAVDNVYGATLNYCCTTQFPLGGAGNITNQPAFVDFAHGNLRLQSNSPCLNAGLNAYSTIGPDLDGNTRVVGGRIDIGAYEFQSPRSLISYAWLQQFRLSTDGSADYSDPDHDGMNNLQEWLAGTDPTDFNSALKVHISLNGANLHLSFTAQEGRTYRIERTADLGPARFWQVIPSAENISGAGIVVEVVEPLTEPPMPRFYRIMLQ